MALAMLLVPDRAGACTQLLGPTIAGQEIPANGVVPIRNYCQGEAGCTKPDDVQVEVQDASGKTVPGTTETTLLGDDGDFVLAWQPDVSLVEGDHLNVSLRAEDRDMNVQDSSAQLRVGPPMGEPTFIFDAPLVFEGHPGWPDDLSEEEKLCCPDVCGQDCIPARRENVALVAAELRHGTGYAYDIAENQYVYRVTVDGHPISNWDDATNGPLAAVSEQADEYCVAIEGKQLKTGTVHAREPECFTHGDLPPFGERPTTVQEAQDWLGENDCDDAPATANEVLCSIGADTCDGGSDSGSAPSDAGPIDAVFESSGRGCSVTPTSSHWPQGLLWLGFGAIVALGRRLGAP